MGESRLTVSVVIITYNAGSYVERALECVYSQSRVPDEVIIIDDGSTDETAQLVRRYPSVRYIFQENEGPSAARNHGAKLAAGDVITFLDVDDLWETDKLKREVAILEEDDTLDIVQGRIVDVADAETTLSGNELRLNRLTGPYHFVNLGSLSIRRSSFFNIGLFDVTRKENEDTDWFLRAWESGANKKTVSEVSLYYTIRGDSLSAGGSSGAHSLPSLLKQHRDRSLKGLVGRPKTGLKDFFVEFPDRSKRNWKGDFVNLRLRERKKNPTMEDSPPKKDAHVEQQFRLARVWMKRGRWKQALESYRRVVAGNPDHIVAHVEMGKVLDKCGSDEEILDYYSKTLERFPNEAELHKAYIDKLEQTHGIERAFKLYDLNRVDDKKLSVLSTSLVCVFVCRNESKRLPYFLEYYREKGITHFFAIDNGSDDGTKDFLVEQADVYLWCSGLSFNQANFGSVWFELVLRTYALGCWCVTVDVDEILYYPDCEQLGLSDLCARLDREGKRILSTVLLEMYSKEPIATAFCQEGKNFLDTCQYFDAQFYHSVVERAGPYRNTTFFFGGVRERVFGESDAFCQSKVSLIKYDKDCVLAGGQHWTNLSKELISESRGCLLHFKYFSDFEGKVKEEVHRKEHYQGAAQYEQYLGQLAENESKLSLYDSRHSVRFEGSDQIVDLGIMIRTTKRSGAAEATLSIPQVSVLAENVDRPLWSVIVTVYDRLTHLPRCLESILNQAESPADMQIEVVADWFSAEKSAHIQKIVDEVGKGRVSFYPSPDRLGHPYIFNLCLQRALGEWVHIVHDDDWLAPGFYAALRKGIESQPDLGAAFCRYALMSKEGERKWISFLERKDPGVIENWIERIGVYCRLAFSSKVVKRSVYEAQGGFSPSVGSAFDWDMWKRVAMAQPVWFEPEALLFCGREGDSLTDGLMLTGEQIMDSLLSIELSNTYLPEDSKSRISEAAREHYADYAISLAQQQLTAGAFEAAFRNITCGLKASKSKPVQSKLLRVLSSFQGGVDS